MRSFCFFNDTATTEIYTLSLHDALPIWTRSGASRSPRWWTSIGRPSTLMPLIARAAVASVASTPDSVPQRSEEHTSELQSRQYLVCRLLLEKKDRSRWAASSRAGEAQFA